MGVYMCSTGRHIAFISVPPMQAFSCECPPFEAIATAVWETPGLPARLSQAQRDIEQGKGVKAKEYRK